MRLHAHIQLGAGRLDDAETKSSDHIDNPQIPLAPICAIRQLPCSLSFHHVCVQPAGEISARVPESHMPPPWSTGHFCETNADEEIRE